MPDDTVEQVVRQAMLTYYNRDPEALERFVGKLAKELHDVKEQLEKGQCSKNS